MKKPALRGYAVNADTYLGWRTEEDYENMDTYDKYSSLLIEVIKSAYKDNDMAYFKGKAFALHCKLLGINKEDIVKKLLNKLLAGL